jgi:hypothetical protein
MKQLLAVCVLIGVAALSCIRAEDAVPPSVTPPGAPTPSTADASKTDAPKSDAAKPEPVKADGELPKAPEGKPSLNDKAGGETLIGTLSHGGGKGKAAKKSASTALVLKVKPEGKNKDKTAEKRTVTLTATGDILTQLNTLAEKKAHIRVTGTMTGDAMTVTSVTEEATKPKKNKTNA